MGNSIFVVKFDSSIQELVVSLRYAGFFVEFESNNCWNAYASIKKLQPSAVVISFLKNQKQCKELVRNLRSSGSTSYVPILALDTSLFVKKMINDIPNVHFTTESGVAIIMQFQLELQLA